MSVLKKIVPPFLQSKSLSMVSNAERELFQAFETGKCSLSVFQNTESALFFRYETRKVKIVICLILLFHRDIGEFRLTFRVLKREKCVKYFKFTLIFTYLQHIQKAYIWRL